MNSLAIIAACIAIAVCAFVWCAIAALLWTIEPIFIAADKVRHHKESRQ